VSFKYLMIIEYHVILSLRRGISQRKFKPTTTKQNTVAKLPSCMATSHEDWYSIALQRDGAVLRLCNTFELG